MCDPSFPQRRRERKGCAKKIMKFFWGIFRPTNRYLAAAVLGGTNCMRRSYLRTLGTAILLLTISAAEKTNAMQYQQRSSQEASMLESKAAAAVESHHYSEALDLLERVVALRPDDAQTTYRLGL